LNDKGVRWQYDLPSVLDKSRFAKDVEASKRLLEQSLEMKLFAHRTFQEWLRSRQFTGCVITGIADTPISTSGLFDDWVSRNSAQTTFDLLWDRIYFSWYRKEGCPGLTGETASEGGMPGMCLKVGTECALECIVNPDSRER
jgi:hypothetical protein